MSEMAQIILASSVSISFIIVAVFYGVSILYSKKQNNPKVNQHVDDNEVNEKDLLNSSKRIEKSLTSRLEEIQNIKFSKIQVNAETKKIK